MEGLAHIRGALGQNDDEAMFIFSVDSSDEEVAKPTKLSQFLNEPAPNQEKSDRDSSRIANKEGRHNRGERIEQRDRQAAPRGEERRSDRDYEATQQRLLALAQYDDQPSNDSDVRNRTRHGRHKSHRSHQSRSPGDRRH